MLFTRSMKMCPMVFIFVILIFSALANSQSSPPIHVASAKGDLTKLRALVSQGVDVNIREHQGVTPLMFAALNGQLDAAKYLVECGARVNEGDKYGETALYFASIKGFIYVVDFLLKNGADVNLVNTVDGQTPLLVASRNGHLEIVKLLITSGSDVNRQNKNGISPLMATVIGYTGNRVRIAAIGDKKVDLTMDHLAVAKMLIDNGADVLAVDKESKTALVRAHERFKSGKTVGDDMVRLLEESAKSKKSPQ